MDERQRIRIIAEEATALGLDGEALRGLTDRDLDYARALPVLSDLADAAAGMRAADDAGRRLNRDIDTLLRDMQNGERGVAEAEDALPRATFESLKAEYIRLFETCTVRPTQSGQVAWHVGKLGKGQAAYERVGRRLQVPWYFIGIVHGLEASFLFSGHLHNGDPLTDRTVQVPKGRPPVWNPPNDWDSSAVDALTFEGFAGKLDWSLARMLYRWEAYNGFGYRANGIPTPYLWSFSRHYEKGKYKADGKWDPKLVSKQCGAAVMLRALVDDGLVELPPNA